jgi:hypothetical protein
VIDWGARVKSESNQKSGAGMFRASMRIVGAAKVVRVHAKFASKPGDWVWSKPNVEMSTLAGKFGYWW